MEQIRPLRAQLCGRFSVERDGRPVGDALRGRQGRLLFAFLVLHRTRPRERGELIEALWGESVPAAADSALSALVSRLRHVLGWEMVRGRGEVQLLLPAGSFVDVEAALEHVHLGESAVHAGELATAYVSSKTARYITGRTFLAGFDLPWVEAWRRELAEVRLRSLECFARVCLAIGGGELGGADRATRELVELAPYRESAHALRMQALVATGNPAEALRSYDCLRRRLRDDLGVSPGPDLQELYQRLLALTAGSG